MNPKTVLARLNCTLDSEVHVDQLLLLPRLTQPVVSPTQATCTSLVVGYTGSPDSQAALDLAFCVAHQMQLATRQQVTIHVVYVVDCPEATRQTRHNRTSIKRKSRSSQTTSKHKNSPACGTATLSRSGANSNLEKIDQVLWQARCLAEEWRGSFNAHLRFGSIATELTNFVKEENAGLLFVGCHETQHPLVQALKAEVPCSVVGIPQHR